MFNKKFLAALLVAGNLFTSNAHAEVQTYEGVGEYTMGERDTLETAKQGAKDIALRNALEKAGVLIQSHSRTENFELIEDVITSVTGAVLKVIKMDFQREDLLIRVQVTVNIDAEDLNNRLKVSAEAQPADDIKMLVSDQKAEDALTLIRENKFREALPLLIESLQANPKNVQAYERLGLVYNGTGDYAKTIFYCNKAIDLDPNWIWAYVNRAEAYSALNDWQKACADFDKIIQSNSQQVNLAWAYHRRGTLNMQLKNYKQAADDFNAAIQTEPNSAWHYNDMGWAYTELKDYDKAISCRNKAIELDPNYSLPHEGLAWIYNLRGEPEKAVEACNEALRLSKDTWSETLAYATRGEAYRLLKNYTQALNDCNKSIELYPRRAETYISRGKCYEALGDTAKAQADFNKARELGQTN